MGTDRSVAMATERIAPRILPTPQAPLEVAEYFMASTCMTRNHLTLRYWRGSWWRWAGPHWEEVGADIVADEIYTFTRDAIYHGKNNHELRWQPDRRKVGNVLDALRSVCRLDDSVEPSCWLDERQMDQSLACSNGLLNLATRELQLHTPLYFNLHSLPFDYDPDACCPEFDRFVASLWDSDDETRRALMQMLGYLVSGRTDLHCAFALIGASRGGKGVITRLAEKLLGKAAVPLTLSSLGERFGLMHLVGKSLATISDFRTSGRNTQAVVERLLSITGEDAMLVDRKNQSPWCGRLGARIVCASNEMPYLGDASTVVSRRFVILPFSRSFAGHEDRQLENRLAAELSGILNRALDGLVDLNCMGRFAQSQGALEMAQDIADLSSPPHVFLRDACDCAPNYRVQKDKLYQHYRHWARENGHPQLSIEVFAKAIYAAGEGRIKGLRGRDGEGRVQFFLGIRLKVGTHASPALKAAFFGLETLPGGVCPDRKGNRPDLET